MCVQDHYDQTTDWVTHTAAQSPQWFEPLVGQVPTHHGNELVGLDQCYPTVGEVHD